MMNVPAEPTVNEIVDPVKAIENYKRENKYLRDELALHDALVNRNGISYDALSEQQLYEIENQCRRYIDGTLDEIEVKNLRQVQGLLLNIFHFKKNTNVLFVAIFSIFRNICR
jgi:kinesin family protein 6/9